MTQAHKKEYFARIHRAQDFIEQHIGEDLRLDDIAKAAHFSPYHFHRLYSTLTGETLFQFILRIRLERAANRLQQLPDEPVTNVALDFGFSSPATFARAFKDCFGMSASAYRRQNFGKECKAASKPGKAGMLMDSYPDQVDFDINRRYEMHTTPAQLIEVRDLPAKTFAYLRHVGPYAGNNDLFEGLWARFFAWAGPRGLFRPPVTEAITIYHDNPDITAEDKLRISLGITVPPGTPTGGEIALLEIPAGKYVCARFEINASEFGAAWNTVMGEWLPQSGWQPDDNPSYECYLNDPKQHPEGKHVFEIRLGVKPL